MTCGNHYHVSQPNRNGSFAARIITPNGSMGVTIFVRSSPTGERTATAPPQRPTRCSPCQRKRENHDPLRPPLDPRANPLRPHGPVAALAPKTRPLPHRKRGRELRVASLSGFDPQRQLLALAVTPAGRQHHRLFRQTAGPLLQRRHAPDHRQLTITSKSPLASQPCYDASAVLPPAKHPVGHLTTAVRHNSLPPPRTHPHPDHHPHRYAPHAARI